jgi:hypothetical protein
MLEDVVSRQVVEIDCGRIWVGVRRLRKVVQIVDDAHIPVEDIAQDFYSHDFADSFARQMPVVRQGVEHRARGSDFGTLDRQWSSSIDRIDQLTIYRAGRSPIMGLVAGGHIAGYGVCVCAHCQRSRDECVFHPGKIAMKESDGKAEGWLIKSDCQIPDIGLLLKTTSRPTSKNILVYPLLLGML